MRAHGWELLPLLFFVKEKIQLQYIHNWLLLEAVEQGNTRSALRSPAEEFGVVARTEDSGNRMQSRLFSMMFSSQVKQGTSLSPAPCKLDPFGFGCCESPHSLCADVCFVLI